MVVFVDDVFIEAEVPNGSRTHASKWCHLSATTKAELHAFAQAIGLRRSWFQDRPNGHWHYDVTLGLRAKAVRAGAVPIGHDRADYDAYWHAPGREGVAPQHGQAQPAGRTVVVHIRDPHDIAIGRPGKWGNPFVIGKHGNREEVVAKYRAWIQGQAELLSDVASLSGKRIACYCAPQPCHGDVLAELADAAAAHAAEQPGRAVVDRQAAPDTPSETDNRPPDWLDDFSWRGTGIIWSNFAPVPASYDGVEYPTGEHAFNAAKSLDPAVRQRIREAGSPGEAKRLGGPRGIARLRPGWDDTVRYEAMREVVATKFAAGTDAAARLLATGDDLLIEANTHHDQHWGRCRCDKHRAWPGANHLGRTLVGHRAALRGDRPDRWVRIAATGHRPQHMSPAQQAWAAEELDRIAAKLVAQHGMRVAINGGAIGADLMWAHAAHSAGVEALWSYLPFPEQADRWTPEQRDDWKHVTSGRPLGLSTRAWVIGDSYDVRTLHARNDAMMHDAQAMVAIVDPSKTTGGTASMLAKVGRRMPVIRLDIAAREVRIRHPAGQAPGSGS